MQWSNINNQLIYWIQAYTKNNWLPMACEMTETYP